MKDEFDSEINILLSLLKHTFSIHLTIYTL